MATDAYFGNPNIARQGAKARQMAQSRSVSNIADPRTYGFMQGLLGTAPDELGYSVFDNPETKQAAQRAAEIGLIGGGLLQGLPVIGPAVKGYGRLLGSEINKAMLGEGGLLGPITPQVMYVVPPGKGVKQTNLNQGINKPNLIMDEMLNQSDLSYRSTHAAPGPDFGAPLHDLTGGGQMYPADVYSSKAVQYYGTGNLKADREAFALANKVRGNPDAEVTMYRAVPKDENISNINAGDWVTLSKDYAKNHGESVLEGNYKILSQKVKAKDLWTNADSIQEFGYQPQQSEVFNNTGLLD